MIARLPHRLSGDDEELKVLIADDHPLIRKGLGRSFGIRVRDSVDEATTVSRPHIWPAPSATTDHPGYLASRKDGMDVLAGARAALRHAGAHAPHTAGEQYAVRAFRLGASGCSTRPAPRGAVEAIRTIAAGGTYLSPKAKDLVMESLGEIPGEAHETLSERETQVMLHIARGKTVGEIAEQLMLSVKTVSTYGRGSWRSSTGKQRPDSGVRLPPQAHRLTVLSVFVLQQKRK
jgi:DNA-binding NarL/FixJ family response regulator